MIIIGSVLIASGLIARFLLWLPFFASMAMARVLGILGVIALLIGDLLLYW